MKETHAAFVALQRAAATLAAEAAALLKDDGLSLPQYNILRILRGARGRPLPCGDIAERLIARGPDMTRLLDRMQRDGLVARSRDTADRRVVGTRLTPRGRATLRRLDAPLAALHERQLAHLGTRRLRSLIAMLDAALPSPRHGVPE